MKKFTILFAAIALVCFAVPAMAVDWNFYGSARVNTWYVSDDYGKAPLRAGSPSTDSKDSEVRWGNNGQNNSRLGARVKHENVSGRVEIQLKGNGEGRPELIHQHRNPTCLRRVEFRRRQTAGRQGLYADLPVHLR